MRRLLGWLLILLGVFALTAGALLRFYAYDEVQRTPLTVETTTKLTGTADRLDPATGDTELYDVKVTSVTETDDEASDDDVAVFVNTLCVVKDEPGTPDCVASPEDDPDDRLVTASTDVFATDRITAEAIPVDRMDDYLPDDAEPHEGLVNKWPFDAQKEDYSYWDGLLGRAVTAEYVGTETINGLEVYVYEVDVQEEEATVVPAEDGEGIEGLYTSEKTMRVDPVTGSIIDQEQREVRTLPNGDPLIELDVAFTEEQVETNVSDAEDGADQLRLVGVTGPLVGLIVGVLLIAVGLFLVLGARRRTTS
jgi:hypothetical protein